MSVIIRLQNLPWSAKASDIRQYFHGLSIPEGGVHIVGGEKGDAFIAFSTDEDARQAFNRNNGKIQDSQVNLLLSSRTEMQKIIEAARTQSMAAFMGVPQPPVVPLMPPAVPAPISIDLTANTNSKQQSPAKKESRRRSRSRSRSRDRHDRRDRRRDRSRSASRERSRRRRSRTRSRERSRKSTSAQPPRVGVWEVPPGANLLASAADPANILATLVANNLLPNILNGSVGNPLAAVTATSIQERLQMHAHAQSGNVAFQQQQQQQQQHAAGTPPIAQNGYNNDDNRPNSNASNRYNDSRRSNRDRESHRERDRRERDYPRKYPPNNCVKLFPFFGGAGDVKRFFTGLDIPNEGLVYAKDMFGNRNGQIYVNFAYAECKDEALGRHGDRIRNQVVNIEHVPDEEFADVFQLNTHNHNSHNPNQNHSQNQNEKSLRPPLPQITHLKIEVLPIFANAEDVRNIFRNYSPLSVVIEPMGRVKAGWAKFRNARAAHEALTDSNCHVFEGKPIKVVSVGEEEFAKAAHKCGADAPQEASNIISISGLPPTCTERDFMDFFSDVGVMPAKIDLRTNEAGFVDEAVCVFYNVDDAIVGFQKNNTLFGNGNVQMRYKCPEEAPQVMQPNVQRAMPPPLMANVNQNSRSFFPNPNPNQFQGPQGPMRGPRPLPMANNGNQRGPQQQQQMHRFRQPPQHLQQQQQPQQQQFEEDIGDNDALAPPGCVLLMENLPFKAGVDEIVNFLGDFSVPCENVLRKYSANGMPAGEAKIIFNTPEEVFHAIQACRGRRIRERQIHLIQI